MKPAPAEVTTFRTISLEKARLAVKVYNEGLYGSVKNPTLDRDALDMFADGLGATEAKIFRQVCFIGDDYGGVAGYPSALKLADSIAKDIASRRGEYEAAISSTPPLMEIIPSKQTIEILYKPFIKPLGNKSNWLVWATKFWHFLNPNSFPIEDSRVDTFFGINLPNSVDKYLTLCERFRVFALSHQDWLAALREVDAGDAWCDIKLWDKMCYGLVDLDSPKQRTCK